MIRVEFEISWPGRANPVLDVAADVARAVSAAASQNGGVVHRYEVSEVDA